MSKLPKYPPGSSMPVSALPSPASRRRSSTGTAQKSTAGLKGLTPEQEALLQEAMEKYRPIDATKANEFNSSSISTLSSQSDLSFLSTTIPNSNNQSNSSLRKPGARRPSISKVIRQPLLPPLSEMPTGVSTELPISTTQPQALPSKYSLNNSGHQSSISSHQRSFSIQSQQHSTTGSPSTNILPTHPRLQSVATSPRPASPSLSQFSIGDRVVAESMNIVGTLRFLGPIDIKPGTWAGVEVDIPGTGKNDGSVNGKSYFACPPKSGIFVLPSKLSKVDKEPASLPQVSTSIKSNSSAHKLPRPSSTSTNSSDRESSGIPSADPNISKNAQNAALAASRITAGSRASKYIGVTASQLKQRTKPTNIITTPETPSSRDQHQTTKKTSGLARPNSNNNLKSLSLSQPSLRGRSRSNSVSSNGSAVSSASQSASQQRSVISRYQNQSNDALSPSDSDMTVIAPINEEMSNKSLQEQVKKLLNNSENSENVPLSLFDQQALRIQQLQMKIEVLEGENARLKLDDKKQTDTGKLYERSRRAGLDVKGSWETEKLALLEEKESMEKALNEKIEDLTKMLQDTSKGQNFRPSTSLSQILDDDLMSDKILQLTELVEQKDEQIKSLEESISKLTKQSNEYQTKIVDLEKINSERADKIEQLATLGHQNSQTESSDRVAQLEKVIQEKSTEIVQLTGNVESIQIESDGKMRALQETIDELKSAGQETINIYELRVSSLEQQVEDLKKAGVETISLYEEATNRISERETKISLLEKEAEELRSAGVEAIDVYEKTIEETKREMESTKNQLARKEEALSAANKEIERLRLLQKELTETKTKREEGLRNELADLQTGLEHMMRADAKSRERIYQLEDEVRDAQALVSRKQEEISALKNNMQNLMAANTDEEIEKIKEVLESDIKRLQYELEEVRKSLSDTQSEKRALVGELDTIKDEKKLIEKKLQDNEKERQDIITEMEVLKSNMSQNENERTQLVADIEEYKANIEEHKANLAKIEEQKTNIIKDAETEKSALMESLENLRKELSESREITQKDLEELQQQLKNKENYADQLKSELDTKITEIKQLNVEFDLFKKDAENSKTVEDPTMSSQDSIKLKTENEQLKKKVKDLAISTKTTEEMTQKTNEYEEKVAAYEEQIAGLKHIVQELTRENVSIAGDNKKILAEQEKLMEAHRQVENECLKLMDELERLHSESLGGQGILSLSPPVEDSYEVNGTSSVGQEVSEEGETSHVGTDASRLQSLLVEKQTQIDRLTSKHNVETRELRQKIQELERSKQREITALNKDVAELESLIESKIFREADLEEEVQKERRNTKKWKDDFEDLKEQLNKMNNSDGTNLLEASILGNGLVDGGSSPRTNKIETSNLYCEICEEAGHDIISCKVVFGSHSSASNASSDTAVDGFTGNHKDERPYCDNCEEHGLHWTEDCPNQDETF